MSKLELLKRKINENVRVDDIIASIFLKMFSAQIPKKQSVIHKAIYDLKKKNNEYEELLNEIVFDVSGITPYSKKLDQILFRLETSSVLGTLNPKYETYDLSNREDWENKIYENLSNEQKELVSKMSEEFKELLTN